MCIPGVFGVIVWCCNYRVCGERVGEERKAEERKAEERRGTDQRSTRVNPQEKVFLLFHMDSVFFQGFCI